MSTKITGIPVKIAGLWFCPQCHIVSCYENLTPGSLLFCAHHLPEPGTHARLKPLTLTATFDFTVPEPESDADPTPRTN